MAAAGTAETVVPELAVNKAEGGEPRSESPESPSMATLNGEQAAAAGVVKAETVEGALPPLESLTCHLCNKYFNDPVTLPCLHSYCRECLDSYNGRILASEPEPTEDDEDDEDEDEDEGAIGPEEAAQKKKKAKKAEPKPVICPCCKDTLHLESPGYFAEPFTNERIVRIVKLLRETHILCQNCEQGASEFRCTVCDAYTCESCFKATHNAPIFRSHKPERLTHSDMTAPPKCESHRVNDIEYFCTEDELGVCQVCLLKGEFKGKEYSLVADVRKQRQEEIEQGVSQALVQRAELLEGRKEVEQTIEELSENLADQQKAVRDNFEAIRAALDAREKATLEALQSLHDSKRSVLDSQITTIDVQKARIEDGVSSVNLMLNHSNDLEVVYFTYVLQNHVQALTDVPPTSPLPGAGHGPAVDADLPVVLSDRVPELVRAYAMVPDAGVIDEIVSGLQDKEVLRAKQGTKEQQEVLRQVAGPAVDGSDYGCLIM
mmetsp:Transcript_4049/g.9410  ORF Transcript_4049/g.9410 Transcript_4049/m.9410 type:complete len:490 (-) Transcript_4049:30-1499(-)